MNEYKCYVVARMDKYFDIKGYVYITANTAHEAKEEAIKQFVKDKGEPLYISVDITKL